MRFDCTSTISPRILARDDIAKLRATGSFCSLARCGVSNFIALDVDIAGFTLWLSTRLERSETVFAVSYRHKRMDYAAFDWRFIEPILQVDGETVSSLPDICEESAAVQEAVVVSVHGLRLEGHCCCSLRKLWQKRQSGSASVLTSHVKDDN